MWFFWIVRKKKKAEVIREIYKTMYANMNHKEKILVMFQTHRDKTADLTIIGHFILLKDHKADKM